MLKAFKTKNETCTTTDSGNAVILPDSDSFALDLASNGQDSNVRAALDQVAAYCKDHPGLIKNVRIKTHTACILAPDNGDKALNEFEKDGFPEVKVLKGFCGGKVMAIFANETTTDFNVAE